MHYTTMWEYKAKRMTRSLQDAGSNLPASGRSSTLQYCSGILISRSAGSAYLRGRCRAYNTGMVVEKEQVQEEKALSMDMSYIFNASADQRRMYVEGMKKSRSFPPNTWIPPKMAGSLCLRSWKRGLISKPQEWIT